MINFKKIEVCSNTLGTYSSVEDFVFTHKLKNKYFKDYKYSIDDEEFNDFNEEELMEQLLKKYFTTDKKRYFLNYINNNGKVDYFNVDYIELSEVVK